MPHQPYLNRMVFQLSGVPDLEGRNHVISKDWPVLAATGAAVGGGVALWMAPSFGISSSLGSTTMAIAGAGLGASGGVGVAYGFTTKETIWFVVLGGLALGGTVLLWKATDSVAAAAPSVAQLAPLLLA